MTGPKLDNRVSLGNVLVAGGMLVSIAIAWGALSHRADTLTDAVNAQRAVGAANEARIRTLENAAARQDERLILILDTARKIEARVDAK